MGFVFDAAMCGACALRIKCVAGKKGKGRTVSLHPQEALLQRARALQYSETFSEYRERRQVSEHRLTRLVQLGVRQARYFGRVKTLFQLLLAATVANLTLVATKVGMMGRLNRQAASFFAALWQLVMSTARTIAVYLRPMPASIPLPAWLTQSTPPQTRGCRLDF